MDHQQITFFKLNQQIFSVKYLPSTSLAPYLPQLSF